MQIPVCEIFWQRFFISWINGAIFYLHDVNFWLSCFGPSFRYNLVTIGVLEFVVVIDVYAQPTREKIKFYRTASKTQVRAYTRTSTLIPWASKGYGRRTGFPAGSISIELQSDLPNILIQVKLPFGSRIHMANGLFNRYATPGRAVDQAQYDEGLRQHMLSVYNYMMVGLGLTGLVAFGTAMLAMSNPAFAQALYGSPLKWVVMLAPLGFVFFLSANIHSMARSAAQMSLWGFAAVMGLPLASIFLVFTGASMARVFFITGATFGAMSLWGYTTRRDLSGMGSFLMMGLIGIIIASVVNIFLASSALQFAVSVIGVLIFTGLTAYDTQRIKEEYNEGYGSESLRKMALMGALSLYLNFINLFTMLLQLFGQRE